MSGHSDLSECPNCSSTNMDTFTDYKPYDYVSGICLECGFNYVTRANFLTLEQLNEERRTTGDLEDYPILTELPAQDFEI